MSHCQLEKPKVVCFPFLWFLNYFNFKQSRTRDHSYYHVLAKTRKVHPKFELSSIVKTKSTNVCGMYIRKDHGKVPVDQSDNPSLKLTYKYPACALTKLIQHLKSIRSGRPFSFTRTSSPRALSIRCVEIGQSMNGRARSRVNGVH